MQIKNCSRLFKIYISCVQAAGLFHFLKIYDNIKKGIDSRVDRFQNIFSLDVVAAVVWPDFQHLARKVAMQRVRSEASETRTALET
jgi:hypothetical protein